MNPINKSTIETVLKTSLKIVLATSLGLLVAAPMAHASGAKAPASDSSQTPLGLFEVPVGELGSQGTFGTCYAFSTLSYLNTAVGLSGEKLVRPELSLVLLALYDANPYFSDEMYTSYNNQKALFEGGNPVQVYNALTQTPELMIPVSKDLNYLLKDALPYKQRIWSTPWTWAKEGTQTTESFREEQKEISKVLYKRITKALGKPALKAETEAFVASLANIGLKLDNVAKLVVYEKPVTIASTPVVEQIKAKKLRWLGDFMPASKKDPTECRAVAYKIVSESLAKGLPVIMNYHFKDDYSDAHSVLVYKLFQRGSDFKVAAKNSWDPWGDDEVVMSLGDLCDFYVQLQYDQTASDPQ